MISIDEALQLVLASAKAKNPVRTAVRDSVGLVLAENVASDVDSPPHDKAMVDGYAVVKADLAGATVELVVIEEVTAGAVPTKKVAPGLATRIMTGAPVPDGAEAVVMIEQTEQLAGNNDGPARVRINDTQVAESGNIMRRATSLAVGGQVLASGTEIRPIEVGVLSEVGRVEVDVFPRPTLAVLSTGNELVSPDVRPAAGQIRNSNSPMLSAQADRAGAGATDLGIARDVEEEIETLVRRGLEHDVLVLSGGVSAGVLDLVPAVLQKLRVEQVFHKVHLKPGKPLWFGVHEGANRRCLVFGLPGNPVSSLVCFELFVRPAIGKIAGNPRRHLPRRCANLVQEFVQRGDRPTYFPAALHDVPGNNGLPRVEILNWRGSADLSTLAQANCLVEFAPGQNTYAAGDRVNALML